MSRDRWSSLALSSILLNLVVQAFIPVDEALVFGIDETLERRRGKKIKKRAFYRDPVRSTASRVVKSSGLRWMSVMVLTSLPWLSNKCWALPIITALCPSSHFLKKHPRLRTHKTLTVWAGQLLGWLDRQTIMLKRKVYLVGDGAYATYELLSRASQSNIGLITRMRMDARLFHLPKKKPKGRRGQQSKIGGRLLNMTKRLTDRRIKWTKVVFNEWYGKSDKSMQITFGVAIWYKCNHGLIPVKWVLVKDPEGQSKPVLLVCTNLTTRPIDIVKFFVRRWQVEVTFAEARRHLGVETQRQWSDLAIERATPLLMGMMSIVCLLADELFKLGKLEVKATAWYQKNHFTFSDILAGVRKHIWQQRKFLTCRKRGNVKYFKRRIAFLEQMLVETAA